MDGVLIIDKPTGPTSHDIVAAARRAIGETRVGHTGTLDPAASGVLPLVVGKATRLARFLSAGDKSYDAVVRLGFSTDTGDAGGAPIGTVHDGPLPSRSTVDAALDRFRGSFLQQPPAYSAKKVDGRRSYTLARAGIAALPEPSAVSTQLLELISLDDDRVTLRVDCSAGFYVRSLAHDLGESLGIGAHLASLRRTRSGDYWLAQAVPFEVLVRDREAARARVEPLAAILPRVPAIVLTADGVKRARHGRQLGPADIASADEVSPGADPWVRLMTLDGDLVGVAQRIGASGLLHPSVVLM